MIESDSKNAAIKALPGKASPRRGLRQEAILAAATAAFSSTPYERVAMADIARAIGCVEGTLYTYFPTKRALLEAVLAKFYDRLIDDIAPRLEAIADHPARLLYLLTRHLRIAVDDPGLAILIAREARVESFYRGSPLHRLNRKYSRLLTGTLQQAQQAGWLRADIDLSLMRDLIFGGLEHVVWNTLSQGKRLDPSRKAQDLMTILSHGCISQPPQEASFAQRLEQLEVTMAKLQASPAHATRK
jgi:AcrR family transcriptional regulator